MPRRGCVHTIGARKRVQTYRSNRTQGKTTTERGYGHSWRKLKNSILQRDGYLCQECKRNEKIVIATECDHIVPKAEGGTDAGSNLQSLCGPCHRRKTELERQRGYGRKMK